MVTDERERLRGKRKIGGEVFDGEEDHFVDAGAVEVDDLDEVAGVSE